MIESIEFKCPKCLEKKLESIECNATVASVITQISVDGDFDYNSKNVTILDSEISRFQCVNCGYILKDVEGYNVNENEDVVEWIKDNS